MNINSLPVSQTAAGNECQTESSLSVLADNPKVKSSQIEVDERVNIVFNLLLSGINRQGICRYTADLWDLSVRQTDRYIQLANAEFRHISSRDRELNFGKAAARLEYLYDRATQSSDYRQALAVEKEIIALYGLQDLEIEDLKERIASLERIRNGQR